MVWANSQILPLSPYPFIAAVLNLRYAEEIVDYTKYTISTEKLSWSLERETDNHLMIPIISES